MKMKKKILPSVLIAVLMASSTSFAMPNQSTNLINDLGETKTLSEEDTSIPILPVVQRELSEKEVLAVYLAKDIIERYDLFDSSVVASDKYTTEVYQSDAAEFPYEEISYVSFNPKDFQNRHYSLGFDSKGNLYSFYAYSDFDENAKANISNEQAIMMGNDFLKNVGVDISNYKPLENTNENDSVMLDLNFVKVVNGINAEFDYIYVNIDKKEKKVTGFSMMPVDNLSFEQMKDILSKDKAFEEIFKNVKIVPVYSYDYKENVAKLVYQIEFNSSRLYAKDGKTVYDYGNPTRYESPSEIKVNYSYEQVKGELDTVKLIEKTYNVKLQYLDKYDYEDVVSYRYADKNDIDNVFSFELKNNSLISFSNYKDQGIQPIETDQVLDNTDLKIMRPIEDVVVNYSYEQGYLVAIDAISKMFPQNMKNISLNPYKYEEDLNYPEKEYYFNFERIANGYNFPEHSISVSVDKETGKVTSAYKYFDELIKIEGNTSEKISEKEALKIFKENIDINLFYSIEDVDSKEARLVYDIDYSKGFNSRIDAKTGEFIKDDMNLYEKGQQ